MIQPSVTPNAMSPNDDSQPADSTSSWRVARDFALRIGAQLEYGALAKTLAEVSSEITAAPIIVLTQALDDSGLEYAASSVQLADKPGLKLRYKDSTTREIWRKGHRVTITYEPDADSTLMHLLNAASLTSATGIPVYDEKTLTLHGVILVGTTNAEANEALERLEPCLPFAVMALQNSRRFSINANELSAKTHELALTRRVDRELNDTMKQSHVFEITLDWALRVALADCAALMIYDQNTDELRSAIDLGYEAPPEKIAMIRKNSGGGIAHRVARSGHTEVIPDVSLDMDYVQISPHVRSHVSVPVMREDRVIAVISVESRRLSAFNDSHVDFIEKLATRAGVAIDNARLYAEAVREREKLALILGATSDSVMAVGADDQLLLINAAALTALKLQPDRSYIGDSVSAVWEGTPLVEIFRRAKSLDQMLIEELNLPDGRIYHARFTPHIQIGWVIVMHDITEFKKTDQLKTDLVATVSHDLKQPLMIMNGYVELLQIHQAVNERGERYVKMLLRSIQSMRQLIDDLLDLARIEGGLQLRMEAVDVSAVLAECIENVRPLAESKQMKIITTLPENTPSAAGEHNRMVQIFGNLISNAVKYTPPEGIVSVSVESRDSMLRIAVQDNGVGISPQDQTRIFDRFYRVRSVENESIEGSGLGLAIVKRLVDMHKGQIGLESRVGYGTTFYVTLPVYNETQ